MGLFIRQADLAKDRDKLIEALLKYLTPLSTPARFDWLYKSNPHGIATAWLAIAAATESVVGVAAAFPRIIYCNGRRVKSVVFGDFCIDPQYRSLGPALQLQQACLQPINAGDVDCCYDFPSANMMAVYRRLRISETGTMVRLAKPLRVDRKVREFVSVPGISQSISLVGNLFLRLTDGFSSASHDLQCSFQQQPCGEEFTLLAEQTGDRCGIHIERSAAYLNWRFLSHPLLRHEMMTVRNQGKLVGYAVFTQTGEDATLIDLFGFPDQNILRGLVQSLFAQLRKRGVVMISAPIYSSHPWMSMLGDLGFKKRETTPVVIHWAPRLRNQATTNSAATWCLISGDRDS